MQHALKRSGWLLKRSMQVNPKFRWLLLPMLIGSIVSLTGCGHRSPDWDALQVEIAMKFPAVKQVSLIDFKQRYQDSILIDVREPAEYAISHLPGAINLQDVDRIADLADHAYDNTVVLYCSVGYRSSAIAQQLADIGVDNVVNLQGSLFAWANQGHRLVSRAGITSAVHPYNEYWGQLLNTNIAVHY